MKQKLTLLALLTAFSLSIQAQESANKEALFQEIYVMDSLLFTAFNTHDLATLGTLFSEDLEFFHDKTGLTGYAQNMEVFKTIFTNDTTPQRELIKASMEVFPVPDYGAVQTGSHRFCHLENGKMDCGTFKFVHIWQKKDGQWKLARIVSFDH